MGLSVGTNVLVSNKFAAKDKEGMEKVVHTAVLTSVICGFVLGIFGFFASPTLLKMMDNPIELAAVYLKIYFIGLPFNMLYNFAAAILRGIGDTKRPLYFLSAAGMINLLLNLFFVIVCDLSVAGVALATIISQAISCIFIMICLMKTKESYHFSFKKLKIYKNELFNMVRIGLPAGIQGSIFSISNVLIQSSVNAFGATAINGNSAASSLEGFVYTAMNAIYTAALSFTSQNVGAKKYNNIKKVTIYGLLIVTTVGVIMGGTVFIFGKTLLKIYTKVPAELDVGYIRLHYLCLPYFLCGIMDVMCGVLRGLGYAVMPMVVSLVGACGFRVLWILCYFRPHSLVFTNPELVTNIADHYNDLHMLYISYPISWILTFSVHVICYLIVIRKFKKPAEDVISID
jgi:putative MATE family efflux protein